MKAKSRKLKEVYDVPVSSHSGQENFHIGESTFGLFFDPIHLPAPGSQTGSQKCQTGGSEPELPLMFALKPAKYSPKLLPRRSK